MILSLGTCYHDVRDLGPEIIEQIKHSFVSYDELEGERFCPSFTQCTAQEHAESAEL